MDSNYAVFESVSKLRLKKLTSRFQRFGDGSDYNGYFGEDGHDGNNPYAITVEDYSCLQNLLILVPSNVSAYI